MTNNLQPEQFEYLTSYTQDIKVTYKGEKLIGDIDFMHSNQIQLFPPDPDLKTILKVNTTIFTTDTSANTVEADVDFIVNIYNHEQPLGIEEIYGIFCYATIVNFLSITKSFFDKCFLHDNEIYKPTAAIPSFDKKKEEIIRIRNNAYGLG